MAKITSMRGPARGKVGDIIYAVNSGVQMARQYQPNVNNPQTEKQIESRAKLKELSQLSAALAPLMGFVKKGMVSARNQFTKANWENVAYVSDTATLNLSMADLTGSRVGLGVLNGTRAAGKVDMDITSPASDLISVVYGVTLIKPNGAIIVLAPRIVTSPGVGGDWPSGDFDVPNEYTGMAFAFGIRANDANSIAKYGYISAAQDSVVSLMATIKEQYAGSQTTTETLHYAFSSVE